MPQLSQGTLRGCTGSHRSVAKQRCKHDGTWYVSSTHASGNVFVHIFSNRRRVGATILLSLLMHRVMCQGNSGKHFR